MRGSLRAMLKGCFFFGGAPSIVLGALFAGVFSCRTTRIRKVLPGGVAGVPSAHFIFFFVRFFVSSTSESSLWCPSSDCCRAVRSVRCSSAGLLSLTTALNLVARNFQRVSLSLPVEPCSSCSALLVLVSSALLVSVSSASLSVSCLSLFAELLKVPLEVLLHLLVRLIWAASPHVKRLVVVLRQITAQPRKHLMGILTPLARWSTCLAVLVAATGSSLLIVPIATMTSANKSRWTAVTLLSQQVTNAAVIFKEPAQWGTSPRRRGCLPRDWSVASVALHTNLRLLPVCVLLWLEKFAAHAG
jgi:hypothetical protein